MKLLKQSLFIAFLLVVLTACKKNEDDETQTIQQGAGSIFVTVVFNGQLISGANVFSNPETSEGTTNETGNLMIENVPPGIYQVFATKEGLGSGSGALSVSPGDLGDVQINLVPGGFQGPMVNIMLSSPQVVGMGTVVTINALVFDNVDAVADLAIEWSTDIDGVISTEGVGANNVAVLEHVFEEEGLRTLTVTVTNSEGNTASDEIEILVSYFPDPVVLDPVEVQDYALSLNWSQTSEDNFISYRVYRQGQFGGYHLIEETFEINTTSYTDSDVSIDVDYNYRIGLYLDNGEELMSNIETGQCEGHSFYIGTGLDMIRHDPNNPIIYGLDTDNNSLVFINTELEEVVNTIYVGPFPTDMDFSLDHQLLYIANYGSSEITVVNLASQSVQNTLTVDTEIGTYGGNPYTLAVLANGLLAYSSKSQFNNVKVVDNSNGDHVSFSFPSVFAPYMASNSTGTKLYVGRRQSGNQLRQYDLVGDELVVGENIDHYGSGSTLVLITNNDEYVFFADRKYPASDISTVLGIFSDKIYAINSNGTRALGENEIFDGNSFNTLGDLPVETRVSVFGNDDVTVYLYYEQLARLYKYTIE